MGKMRQEPRMWIAKCVNCDADLEEVFPGSARHYQYVDALNIQIHMGYGEFQDHDSDQDGSPQACFCQSCAMNLVAQFPGIQKMLDDTRR